MATLVEGDPKAPFSIATTLRCWVGLTPFPGLLHFILDPCIIMLSVKQGGIKYHFGAFGTTWSRTAPWYPGALASTLLIWPMYMFLVTCISVRIVKQDNAFYLHTVEWFQVFVINIDICRSYLDGQVELYYMNSFVYEK